MEANFEGERDKAKERIYPYKIACLLVFASDITPGITRTSPGTFTIDFATFRREMNLPSRVKLQMYLHIMRDMGILKWVQTHKSYAIVALANTDGWDDASV